MNSTILSVDLAKDVFEVIDLPETHSVSCCACQSLESF